MHLTSATFLTLLATAAAYPLQARSSCSVDGALVCNGASQFALCNAGNVVWQAVSDGTACVCDGTSCTITAVTGGAGGAGSAASVSGSTGETTSATAVAGGDASVSSPAAGAPSPTADVVANGAAGMTSFTMASPPTSATPAAATEASPSLAPAAAASTSNPATPASSSSDTSASSPSSEASSSSSSSTTSLDYIKNFLGNGAVSQGWPAQSAWLDFDNMWAANLDTVISVSCTQFGQANNSPQESDDLKSAIQSVASSSGVDARFILAITLQESNGCVRAPTTNYGVTNPGLMQSHDGSHSCADVNPCPADEITGMIQDGTQGTSSGPGLQQLIAQTGASDVSKFYKASVLYNSGSIPANGLLQDGTATACYATDVANRLIGWSKGPSSCTL